MAYFCQRCGYSSHLIFDVKRHLTKAAICEPTFNDTDRAVLLEELGNSAGKTRAKKPPHIKEDEATKDEVIAALRAENEMLRKYVSQIDKKLIDINTMNYYNKSASPSVGIEVVGTCEKCGLEGVEDMEAHIRECNKAAEFNNVYSYTKGTFGRNMYGDGAGEIYIVQTDFTVRGAQYYKIGRTTNIKFRMVQYRTGAVCEPRLHCYFPFRNIERADKDIKKLLEQFNIKREIYSGEFDEIRSLIRGYQMRADNCAAEFVPTLKCAPSVAKKEDAIIESLLGLEYGIDVNMFMTY